MTVAAVTQEATAADAGNNSAVNNVTSAEPAIGSNEWYANYNGFKCVQDCPINATMNHRCGGLLLPTTSTTNVTTNSSTAAGTVAIVNGTSFTALGTTTATAPVVTNMKQLYPTATECCTAKFPYLALGLCVASSEHDGSGVGNYTGSGDYYVDYGNGRCVQDCDPPTADTTNNASISTTVTTTNDGICGGIVLESSTILHANATDCCSSQLSYMDLLLCTTRSKEGGVEGGTFRLYPRESSGACVIDHDPTNAIICSIGYDCHLIGLNAWVPKLYPVSPAGVEECCSEGLPHVNPSYCRAKTMGIVSRKWFVDYDEGLCHQDCEAGTGPSCAINTDPAVTYYDSPEECCASQLGFRNQPKCHADSTGAPYEGTRRYYVDYRNSRCAQDCPSPIVVEEERGRNNDATLSSGTTNNANTICGGLVVNSTTVLHDDASSCCAATLGYMHSELCLDRSNGTATGTGLYYPIEEGICVKDTSATPCPSGETCLRVDGWLSTLYGTIAECCNSDNDPALPADVNPAYCEALSTGIGPDEWFQHPYGDNRCAKHCANAISISAECAIPTSRSVAYHPSASECCVSEFAHLNADTCTEFSETGGVLGDVVTGTEAYYVDWVRQKCVKNCPKGSSSGGSSLNNDTDVECGGIAAGSWVTLFPNTTSCCEKLHYLDDEDCLVGQ
mmetsp:Transcript_28994/g.53002  ORF Transcript_28994/g.53002 Transcript_28994/m.53002 type:complete len:675 (-) Transcript_28994:143-2167(-)